MNRLKNTFKEIARYPSAVIGLGIIFSLILMSIYAIIAIPYDEVVQHAQDCSPQLDELVPAR